MTVDSSRVALDLQGHLPPAHLFPPTLDALQYCSLPRSAGAESLNKMEITEWQRVGTVHPDVISRLESLLGGATNVSIPVSPSVIVRVEKEPFDCCQPERPAYVVQVETFEEERVFFRSVKLLTHPLVAEELNLQAVHPPKKSRARDPRPTFDFEDHIRQASEVSPDRHWFRGSGWAERCQLVNGNVADEHWRMVEGLFPKRFDEVAIRLSKYEVLRAKKYPPDGIRLLYDQQVDAPGAPHRYLSLFLRRGTPTLDMRSIEPPRPEETYSCSAAQPFNKPIDFYSLIERAADMRVQRRGKKHVVLIQTQGVQDHNPDLGTQYPDVGGQSAMVNSMGEYLRSVGFEVTIINAGEFLTPGEGRYHGGCDYKDAFFGIERIPRPELTFRPKELMYLEVNELAQEADRVLCGRRVDAIFANYAEGMAIGTLLYERLLEQRPHAAIKMVHIPHSLGAIKKQGCAADYQRTPADQQDEMALKIRQLNFPARIAWEMAVLEPSRLRDAPIGVTSQKIEDSLSSVYGVPADRFINLPPMIDDSFYRPFTVDPKSRIFDDIRAHLLAPSLNREDVVRALKVVEASRTDVTKRKDLLIKGFADLLVLWKRAQEESELPEILLTVNINPEVSDLYLEYTQLIDALDERLQRTHGTRLKPYISLFDGYPRKNSLEYPEGQSFMPVLYNIASVYATTSHMEGFGMSASEAAASGIPCVAFRGYVPFIDEYLMGPEPKAAKEFAASALGGKYWRGPGAIVVNRSDNEPRDSQAFAQAMFDILYDSDLKASMSRECLCRISPIMRSVVMDNFLRQIGLSPKSQL